MGKVLANGVQADLKVVECENYGHSDWYQLPIHLRRLPNMASVYLYPSLCLFEGRK